MLEVEQQLQAVSKPVLLGDSQKTCCEETMAQLEEMRKAYNLLQEQVRDLKGLMMLQCNCRPHMWLFSKVSHSEQKLADAEAEKLRMGVARGSAGKAEG